MVRVGRVGINDVRPIMTLTLTLTLTQTLTLTLTLTLTIGALLRGAVVFVVRSCGAEGGGCGTARVLGDARRCVVCGVWCRMVLCGVVWSCDGWCCVVRCVQSWKPTGNSQ